MKYSLESKLKKLCVGCGACQGICPQHAINLSNKNGFLSLSVNPKKCSGCGLCIKICPIYHAALHETPAIGEKDIIGHYNKIYVGYALDEKVRWGGASGGVITVLLLKMLKEGLINGALVSRMKGPGVVEAYIARNVKEVLEAQGSIYFPTYAAKQIRDIRANDGSYAIVGLPCQITAFKKAERLFLDLSERVFIYLGLFCHHVNEFWYLDYFIKKIAKMKLEEVFEVSPRRGGWPGFVQIRSAREAKEIPFFKFWGPLQLLYLTSPIGCLFCCDHTNVFSDLSFGDAWLPSLMKKDTLGSSLIIARTSKGSSLLKEAEDDGLISLREVTVKELFESQNAIFYKKKFVSSARSFIQGNFNFSLKNCVQLLPLINAKIARKNGFRNLIYALPESLLGKYAFILYKLIENHH